MLTWITLRACSAAAPPPTAARRCLVKQPVDAPGSAPREAGRYTIREARLVVWVAFAVAATPARAALTAAMPSPAARAVTILVAANTSQLPQVYPSVCSEADRSVSAVALM